MATIATTAPDAYIPGVCNINRTEIARRRKAGYFGLGLFVVVAGLLLALPLARWFRLILFVPAFIGAIGFLQAKNKFCVAYGGSGQQHASENSTSASKVTDDAAVTKDKRRARAMNLQAAGMAVVLTASMLLLPVRS